MTVGGPFNDLGDGDPPAYLKSAVVLRSSRPQDAIEFYAQNGNRALMTAPTQAGFFGLVSGISWNGGSLYYGEVKGTMLVAMASRGREISLGALLFGEIRCLINGERLDLMPMSAVIGFPGDELLYLLHETRSFTLRVPVANELFFRVKGLPLRMRRSLPRQVPPAESVDFIRMIQFISTEFERWIESGRNPTDELQILGDALSQRLGIYLERCLGPVNRVDPELMRICVEGEAFLTENFRRKVPAEELANMTKCSVRQLYRAYETVTGITPNAYQLRSRLLASRAKIVAGTIERVTIASISHECGFASSNRFSAMYEAEFGELPKETRRRCESQIASLTQEAIKLGSK